MNLVFERIVKYNKNTPLTRYVGGSGSSENFHVKKINFYV